MPDTVLSFNGWRLDGASIEAGYTVKTDMTLTAQWKAPPSVTKENFSAVIRALTEDSTIVLTEELTNSDLTAIATAIMYSRYKVNLNLSNTTGITSIPSAAFSSCTKLSGITIPESVTAISNSAFRDCIALSSVTIPDSVTRIDDYAFWDCTSISSVTIPDSVTYIGGYAFYGCTSLSSVTIPDSVTTIDEGAFTGCSSLSSVTIGDSVTSINDMPFGGCTSLTTITVDSNNPNYSSIDGVLFNKDATAIIIYPPSKQSAAYTIPDSVTSIEKYAFSGCTSLSSITIGDSVTSIGSSTFSGCTALTSVTIPDSVTYIGGYAFYGCTSLSSVTIPDSVTSIGNEAFYGCSKLTSISFIDTTTWYRTDSSLDWKNKINGTLTDVSDAVASATYFTSTYKYYYWYKL